MPRPAKKKQRLPNGFGRITEIKGKNLRCPYRAMVTAGKDAFGAPVGKILGYYETYNKAYEALMEYNKNPYDLDVEGIRFSEVYEKWSKDYFKTLSTQSSVRTIEAAYKYCSPLFNMRFKDIRIQHMKGCIEDATVGPSTKGRMKSLLNLIFDWAVERELATVNYARNFEMKGLQKEKEASKKEKVPFSLEEIEILWNSVNRIRFADMVLIGIYSGWRPQELAVLKTADIDLENGTMRGGLKTNAGKNRIVPIHPYIRPLIIQNYDKNREYLFNDENGQKGTYMTYDKYRHRFIKVMDRLNLKHSPHETRHTFITIAKKCHVDEYAIKRIVGHAVSDITENIYTHRDIEWLKEEMQKINYGAPTETEDTP